MRTLVHSLVGACRLRPLPTPRCALSPSASDLGWQGWGGDWSCCCRGIPQSGPEGLSLFRKILLLNPATPYKEEPVLSHSPPFWLDWGLSGSGPHTAQLSIVPSQCPRSPCVYHFVLIPLPVTSSNQVSLGAAQALSRKGGSC